MAAEHAARGKKALEAGDYDSAVKDFTAAIKAAPTSPDFFIQRATAYTRLKKHAEALTDAEKGVINAQNRAKKEAIVEAQFRRGIALYQLGRYADAAFVLQLVRDLHKDHKQAAMWISKTTTALNQLPDDHESRRCIVKATPIVKKETSQVPDRTDDAPTSTNAAPVRVNDFSMPQQTPADKIRHEWYQSSENIYFTLFAKGVPKDKAQIDITQSSLSISFPLNNGSTYDLTVEPLFAPVLPEKCITRIMQSKVEIILIKATIGHKWTALEGKDALENPADDTVKQPREDIVKTAILADSTTKANGPSYPTSSKSGPKNWDKVVDDLGDKEGEDYDDDGGDPANALFRKLFKDGSPEMRRAMNKSFTESNGTALSTNWEEVSKGRVKTEPPDGMEAKEYPK